MSPKRQKQILEFGRGYDLTVLPAGVRLLSKAGSAGAPVLRHVRVYRMGAVTADKTPILISDHRPELYAHHAMGAADDQDGVGRHCPVLVLHITASARRVPIVPPSAAREEPWGWQSPIGHSEQPRADSSAGMPGGWQV
jgi:hypothetical protein